jgi:hypothetical protein
MVTVTGLITMGRAGASPSAMVIAVAGMGAIAMTAGAGMIAGDGVK